MESVRYKLWLNGESASAAQLRRVETITVTQAMDQLAQASIEVTVTADDQGNWTGESEDFMQPLTRVRVEVQIGSRAWVPMFEGPVIGIDGGLSAQPGTSLVTLRAADDGYYLMVDDATVRWSGDSDSDLAEQLFDSEPHIDSTDIEETPDFPPDRPGAVSQRHTKMETLQLLAYRNGKHAFVLPGDEPDTSIGCFKAEDSQPDAELPPVTLLGADRNIDRFEVVNQAHRPSDVLGATIDVRSGDVADPSTSRYADQLGDEQSAIGSAQPGKVLLPPGLGVGIDLTSALDGEARRRSYAFTAQGVLRAHIYGGVLQPYKLITVRGLDRLSGNYLIRSVTHMLGRNEYAQTFSLQRKGRSASASLSAPSVGGIL